MMELWRAAAALSGRTLLALALGVALCWLLVGLAALLLWHSARQERRNRSWGHERRARAPRRREPWRRTTGPGDLRAIYEAERLARWGPVPPESEYGVLRDEDGGALFTVRLDERPPRVTWDDHALGRAPRRWDDTERMPRAGTDAGPRRQDGSGR